MALGDTASLEERLRSLATATEQLLSCISKACSQSDYCAAPGIPGMMNVDHKDIDDRPNERMINR